MFSIFARYHRHKELENAIIMLSEEVSSIKLQNARLTAKIAVETREKLKEKRETTKNSLPQDVRDVLANFPDGSLELVRDSEGHVVYNPKEE